MKKPSYLFNICLLFCLTACTQLLEETVQPPIQSKYDRDVYTISQMGYDISDIYRIDSSYVVEKHILITQRHIRDFERIPQTRQGLTNGNTLSEENREVYLNYTGWQYNNAYTEAANYWNTKSKCGVQFHVTGIENELRISEESMDDESILMLVSPPTASGELGGEIIFNTDCKYKPDPNSSQAMYMMLHAMGHAIGFGHTFVNNGDNIKEDFGKYPIDGIEHLRPDSKSIMAEESDPLGWSGFSENDIKAFKAIYPTDEPEPEPEPEPEVDFSDRSMEWIADDGFAIAMGGLYAYGSVNIDVHVRLTGSEWADGQVRGMRIYDLYTGEEVMRGKAGSCRLQPGEYTLHYGAAVRREDGTFECRYGTADFEVTLPGFELTMPILSHPEDIDLSRTIVVRCSFETDDAAWRNFSCSVELVNLRTGEEITHQSYTPNERWAFRLTERGTYRAVATVSNGSETLVIRKDFVLPELTNPKDIYHTLNWRAIDFDKVIQYYIDFYSDEACTEKLSLQHSAACHYIVWRRHHDAEGNPTKNDKVMEDTVMLPAGVTTYNLPYTFAAKDYLTLHGYRYDYEIVGIEYR